MEKKLIGKFGEKIAENFLKKKGYQILDKNYSPRFISGPQRGEIDIVAKKDDIISFVEVKTLTLQSNGNQENPRSRIYSTEGFSPEEKVDWGKQRKIIKMAESWLMAQKIPLDSKWQIDVISIKIDLDSKKAKIRYFPNAIY